MELELLDVAVKIAACVCGKDGVISLAEETEIFNIVSDKKPEYSLKRFNQVIDDYFDESLNLEDYLEALSDKALNEFTLNLCRSSASADGLDFHENIALDKVEVILGAKE